MSQDIIDFKKHLEKALAQAEIIEGPSPRQFRLHITLTRFKPHHSPYKNPQQKISHTEAVNSMVLMQSNLTPTHAEYKILHESKF